MKLNIYIIFLFLFIVSACDVIDKPLKENEGNTCGDETLPIPIRKILVEDYTGQKCNNCPLAAEVLHEIKADYCDHIIPIAVHVGSFATPSGSIFPNDYRTIAGTELDDFYGISSIGLPQGMVNRMSYQDYTVLNKDNWRAAVHALFQTPPDVDIQITTTYDTLQNKIYADINITTLNAMNFDLNIGAYLTEDSIISPQLSHEGIISNYVHRHMLRAAPLGAFGESLASSASIGNKFSKSITFEADTVWKPEHCELIIFVSNAETGQIIQAESEHFSLK